MQRKRDILDKMTSKMMLFPLGIRRASATPWHTIPELSYAALETAMTNRGLPTRTACSSTGRHQYLPVNEFHDIYISFPLYFLIFPFKESLEGRMNEIIHFYFELSATVKFSVFIPFFRNQLVSIHYLVVAMMKLTFFAFFDIYLL